MSWYESGGYGSRTALLLRGLGATAAVWKPVERALEEKGTLRWLAADLGGHGGSEWQPFYSVGQLATQLAELVQQQQAHELFIVGHSLGAYVGLALASGWFGLAVRGVLGIGPKINWPAEEEAWTRYRRVSGLSPDIAAGQEWLARGAVQGENGWRLAQDPRTFAVAGAPFASLAASATVPIVLARGERDPMVSLQELAVHTPQAHDIRGAGHNAHIEQPGAVAALLEQLVAGV